MGLVFAWWGLGQLKGASLALVVLGSPILSPKLSPTYTTTATHPELGGDIRPQLLQALAEGTEGQWNRSPIVDASSAAFGVEAGDDLDGGRWAQKSQTQSQQGGADDEAHSNHIYPV